VDDALSWQDAVMLLFEAGWEGDDIDAACRSLLEECDPDDLSDLRHRQIEEVLDQELEPEEASSLILVAEIYANEGKAGDVLRDALDDLKAFASAYADEEG